MIVGACFTPPAVQRSPMVYVYKSVKCKLCGRSKSAVARERNGPDYDLESIDPSGSWLQWPFCYECVGKNCQEFADVAEDRPQWQCQELQIIEPGTEGQNPPQYMGYCERHWRERNICHKHGCHKRKPAWDTLCPACRSQADDRNRLNALARWRKRGTLCPDCYSAPQNAPQRFCRACLIKRGVEPWEPVTGPWRTVVQAMATPRPDSPQNLEHASKQYDEKKQAHKRALKAARNKRWQAKKTGKPIPPRPAVPSPAKLPKAAPKRGERKWKRGFWTGTKA